MSTRVAITGATGFIGQRLLTAMLARGMHVQVHARRPEEFSNAQVAVVSGALDNADTWQALADGADAIVHVAGAVRGASYADFAINETAVHAALAAAALSTSGIRRVPLLLLSSLAAREPTLSWYAASKRRGEDLLLASAMSCVTALRPPAVYGPGERELLPWLELLAAGIGAIPNRPGARLTVLHVDDLVAAILCWLDTPKDHREPIALCDGRDGGYSWLEVLAMVQRACQRKIVRVPIPAAVFRVLGELSLLTAKVTRQAPMLTPGKVRELLHDDWTVNNDPACALLAWRPQIEFVDALRDLLRRAG